MSQDIDHAVEAALHDRMGKKRGGTGECEYLCTECDNVRTPAAAWNRRKGTWHCMKCGGGGTTAGLAEKLGIHVETPAERAEKAVIGAAYDYRDQDGQLLYQVVRMVPKDFRQRRPDGAGGWIWNLRGVRMVLYHLPQLAQQRGDGPVFVPEGEKDADALIGLGLRATTSPGGAVGRPTGSKGPGKQKWRPEYTKALTGEDVVLLPDNDQAGQDYAMAVAAALKGAARSVKVLNLPGLPPKGDVSDWLHAGGSKEELLSFASKQSELDYEGLREGSPQGNGLFAETDAGNAELFADRYAEDVRYDHQRSRWLIWDRHRWQPDTDGAIYRMAIDAARWRAKQAADLEGEQARQAFGFAKSSESASRLESCLKLASKQIALTDKGIGWDANPLLLGVDGGVVNLALGQPHKPQQTDRITASTGVPYVPEAACPRWLRFLKEVFQGNEELIGFIHRAVGYSLTGSVAEQVWFLTYGSGANGKSKFLDVLRWLGGEYAANMAADTIKRRYGSGSGPTSDLARLAGRRIITCSELAEATHLDEERVKALVHGDMQTARFLRQDDFQFQPVGKIWVATNHLPDVKDGGEGFWRSVRVIPFLAKFSPDAEPGLEAKLRAELPGILRWAVEGAALWHNHGLGRPRVVMMATLSYRESSDPLADWKFERVIFERGEKSTPMELYRSYKSWAESQGMRERELLTSKAFFARLEQDGYRSTKSNGIRVIRDARLRNHDDPPPGEFGESRPSRDEFQIHRDGSEGLSISASISNTASHAKPEKGVQPDPVSLCPLCAGCTSADPDFGCDGSPCWEDEAGDIHCPQHHPEE